MNRIYQGRVTRVEIPDGKGGWQLLGFKPDEAEQLEKERNAGEYLLKVKDVPGPSAILPCGATEDELQQAAALCARPPRLQLTEPK